MSVEAPIALRSKELVRDTLSYIIFNHLIDLEIVGRENLGSVNKEPAIVIWFPHCGHAEAPAVRNAFPRDARENLIFLAAADHWFKDRKMRFLSSLFLRSFSMNRDPKKIRAMIESLGGAVSLLESGISLGISPEGTRSSKPDNERKLQEGVAQLVVMTNGRVPVIPIVFTGLEAVMTRETKMPRFFARKGLGFRRKRVLVVIREKMFWNLEEMTGTKAEKRGEITNEIRNRLLNMRVEAQRAWRLWFSQRK